MAPRLTFIIPVAPYHVDRVDKAVSQVEAQTLPCDLRIVVDDDRRGPSWARNRGVEQSTTPLISFLDADDLLDPTFAEIMTASWRPGSWVFCDFLRGDRVVRTGPERMMTPPRYKHPVVTSVLSRRMFDLLGGFDESLRMLEDTDLWLRCLENHICPIYVRKPLMTYTADGQNARAAQTDLTLQPVWDRMMERTKNTMCVCDNKEPRVTEPVNKPFPGSILVLAHWGGKRTWTGKGSGRYYPASGNDKPIWVDPRDVEKQPKRLLPIVSLADQDITLEASQ